MTTTTAQTQTKFTKTHLDTLRAEFAKIPSAPVSILPKFHALFDRCDDKALKQLAKAEIKFVSRLAVNACVRRGVKI